MPYKPSPFTQRSDSADSDVESERLFQGEASFSEVSLDADSLCWQGVGMVAQPQRSADGLQRKYTDRIGEGGRASGQASTLLPSTVHPTMLDFSCFIC